MTEKTTSSNNTGNHDDDSKPVIPTITSCLFLSDHGRILSDGILTVATNTQPEKQVTLQLSEIKVCGRGTFGSVHSCKTDTGEHLAIKRVFQDERYQNRELDTMRQLNHQNIVTLKYMFFDTQDDKLHLNLILEYMPKTISCLLSSLNRKHKKMPMLYVRLYAYQMFRAIAYLHSKGICHRDIKPLNILVDPETAVLKLCDFGSAKMLIPGEKNKSHICSLYYRAPELTLGSTNYTNSIDIWSVGIILVELVIGTPVFRGESNDDQLVQIIKILGTPTEEQVRQMNPTFKHTEYPVVNPRAWSNVLGNDASPELSDLVGKLLVYEPESRLSPLRSCAHPFFDDLRNPTICLPNRRPLPSLFAYSDRELQIDPSLNNLLFP